MKNDKNKQAGVTAIGFIVILALIAFFVIILLKVTPVYLEYFNVATSLKSLSGEKEINNNTNRELESLLQKRFAINNVSSVKHEHIQFKRDKGVTWLIVKYEVRKPLFGNIDLIMSFDESVELKGS